MDVIASQMRVYVIGFGCHIVQDNQGLLPHHGGADFQPRSSQDICIYIYIELYRYIEPSIWGPED